MSLTRALEVARRRSPRVEWPALALAWGVALALLLAWITLTPVPQLRATLTWLQCWSLDACVVVGAVAGASVLRRLWRELTRTDVAALLGVGVVALGLVLGVPQRTNRIYYDEHIYQSIGRNIAELRLAEMCNDGTIEGGRLRCASGEYNKQPYAYPHLLGLVYRATGVRPGTAFAVNAAAAALGACLVYLLVLLLFEDRVAALLGALLLAFTPEQVVWAATAAVEPSASAAATAAVVAAACFVRWRSTAALVGAAVAAAYAVQFRPESLLIVVPIGVLLWQRARDEFGEPRVWWAGLLFLALVSVHLAHLAAVRAEGWGTTGDRLSMAYVAGNLRVNGWFYLWDPRFPTAWTALACLGLSPLGRTGLAGRAAIALGFCAFLGITLFFYAGSYDYGADVRYSLATYPAIAVLGGLGGAGVARAATRVRPAPWWALAVLLLAAQFLASLPIVRRTTDGAWAARADVAFAESLLPLVGEGGYVLTHNPGMFHVWGVSAGQASLATTHAARVRELGAGRPRRLYLHWSFWCNVSDPVQRAFCTTALERFPGSVVREQRDGGQYLALYRLQVPETGLIVP